MPPLDIEADITTRLRALFFTLGSGHRSYGVRRSLPGVSIIKVVSSSPGVDLKRRDCDGWATSRWPTCATCPPGTAAATHP